jgi:hypothetical protein
MTIKEKDLIWNTQGRFCNCVQKASKTSWGRSCFLGSLSHHLMIRSFKRSRTRLLKKSELEIISNLFFICLSGNRIFMSFKGAKYSKTSKFCHLGKKKKKNKSLQKNIKRPKILWFNLEAEQVWEQAISAMIGWCRV